MALKISIITAVFNSKDTVEDAIKSVIGQTYRPIEYIIIDGGSTDGTLEIIEQYKKSIDIIVSEPDKGIYDALNKGLKLATGDAVGLLHSDDIFSKDTILEQIAQAFTENKPDGVFGNLEYVDKYDTNKVFRYWQSSKFEIKMLKKGWMPPHPTLFLTKSIIEKTGCYNQDYKIAADYDFMLRTLTQPATFFYLPVTITKMRTGGASNRSIKNILLKMWEDYRILKSNKIGGLWTLILKNLSKIGQLF